MSCNRVFTKSTLMSGSKENVLVVHGSTDRHRMILPWCVQDQLHMSAKHEMRCWLPVCDESVKRTSLFVIEARCFR